MDNKKVLIGAACIPVVAAIALVVLTAFGAPRKDGGDGKEVTTGSGLRYVDLKVGDGAEAKVGSKVKVHYIGTLENGMKFDSNLDDDKPFGLKVGAGQVIKGWDEGLVGMRVGGKRKLIVPAKLGYGEQGYPPKIPPNATLIFEIDLLDVQ